MEDLMNGMETTMDEIQYIVVKLGNEKYGIDIYCVDNIVRMQHMRPLPHQHGSLRPICFDIFVTLSIDYNAFFMAASNSSYSSKAGSSG